MFRWEFGFRSSPIGGGALLPRSVFDQMLVFPKDAALVGTAARSRQRRCERGRIVKLASPTLDTTTTTMSKAACRRRWPEQRTHKFAPVCARHLRTACAAHAPALCILERGSLAHAPEAFVHISVHFMRRTAPRPVRASPFGTGNAPDCRRRRRLSSLLFWAAGPASERFCFGPSMERDWRAYPQVGPAQLNALFSQWSARAGRPPPSRPPPPKQSRAERPGGGCECVALGRCCCHTLPLAVVVVVCRVGLCARLSCSCCFCKFVVVVVVVRQFSFIEDRTAPPMVAQNNSL